MNAHDRIELSNGGLRLRLCPAAGGSVAGFWWQPEGRQEPFPLFRTAGEVALQRLEAMDMACFPMVPYCNRVADNRFQFGGNDWHICSEQIPFPHALHGYGWVSAWTADQRSQQEAALEHRHRPLQPGDPYDYLARQLFRLEPDCLSVSLWLQNRGKHPMPFGLGLHPWFERTGRVLLQAAARTVVLADAEQLPTEEVAIPERWRFNQARELPSDHVDNLFTDWPGCAKIAWVDQGIGLRVSVEGPLCHYMLFAPDDRPLFCFEPVSHRVDGQHQPKIGGLEVLAPGESLAATVRFSPFILDCTSP